MPLKALDARLGAREGPTDAETPLLTPSRDPLQRAPPPTPGGPPAANPEKPCRAAPPGMEKDNYGANTIIIWFHFIIFVKVITVL